jgi:hypothetical protein
LEDSEAVLYIALILFTGSDYKTPPDKALLSVVKICMSLHYIISALRNNVETVELRSFAEEKKSLG